MGKITCYVDGIPRQVEVDLNHIHHPKLRLLRITVRSVDCVCVLSVCLYVLVYVCGRAFVYESEVCDYLDKWSMS